MLSLRQLAHFVSVVDEGSFTAAAAEAQVSQPGLSRQVRALEDHLGGPLVERLPRGNRLTPLGRAVLPRARATLADADLVEQTARQIATRGAGELVVATVNSLSLGVLPGVLRAWRAERPEVAVRLHEHNDVVPLLEAFAEGQADLAVTPLPDEWSGERQLVGEEEFVVAVGPEHPLAGHEHAALAEFAHDAWVHFAGDHGLRGVLDHVAAGAGFEPRVAIRTGQTAAAPSYAAAGVGVALVPANILGLGFGGAAIRLEPPMTRRIYVICREPADALTTAFLDTVKASADLRQPEEPAAGTRRGATGSDVGVL